MTTAAGTQLADLVANLRAAASRVCPARETAERVAEVLRAGMPTTDLLTADQLAGDPRQYAQHVLHAEPDGLFSVVALVWLPGQATPTHDHLCWCVVGVVEGVEDEVVYTLVERDGGPALVEAGRTRNVRGDVCAFVPPGDIHEVRNAGTTTAVSLHVYGADIARVGSSVRRRYDLPVVPA